MENFLPIGKLPVDLLIHLLAQAPHNDPRVILGPGIGLDCAVIDFGESLLVIKTDPITFASDEIGWYAVQVNANDIATTGATPRWFMLTLLLPENQTTPELIEKIIGQVYKACQTMGVSVVGGHTEITHDLKRPILVGTMLGEVSRQQLITPRGAKPGDSLLLTKGIPIEATAILAREFPEHLSGYLTTAEIATARDFLYTPGISILRDAQIAISSGKVNAMHDPTEGGLAGALWELAESSQRKLVVNLNNIPVPPLSARICRVFDLNPWAVIASGALLLSVAAADVNIICKALEKAGIVSAEIGYVEDGPISVWLSDNAKKILLPRPEQDELTKLYEQK